MIIGYKCFDVGLINRYGMKFDVGKDYHVSNEIKYQNNGFHMCTNLEDTLRYFDAMNGEVEIAKVIGYGSIDEYDDEYNGFYEMYAVENIRVLHI